MPLAEDLTQTERSSRALATSAVTGTRNATVGGSYHQGRKSSLPLAAMAALPKGLRYAEPQNAAPANIE